MGRAAWRVEPGKTTLRILCIVLVLFTYNWVTTPRYNSRPGLDFEALLANKRESLHTKAAVTSPRPTRPAVQVLLLTYMRSGSSFAGDVLQRSPEAFYLFEPLRSLHQRNYSTFTIEYANGTRKLPPYRFEEEAARELYNWFTCDVTSLSHATLMDGFMSHGIKSNKFRECFNQVKDVEKHNTSYAIQECAGQLQTVCETSPYRVVKTIRVSLASVKHLLDMLPNLKILHLIRDPRATLFSQSQFGMCPGNEGGTYGCTSRYCTRVEDDVIEAAELIKKHPNRVTSVFYEQLAKYPMQASKKMLSFVGAEFTRNAMEYIYNITMAGNTDNCVICTTRSNSSQHIDAWKTKMNPAFVNVVEERCNFVLKHFNYKMFLRKAL